MNTRSRNLVIAAVLGVVVLAIAAVLLSGGGSGDDDGTVASGISEYQAVDVRGAALPEFQSTQNDAAVGKPIPQLIGHGFDGTPVHIAADGKPKLLLFLAHWCPHCQKEVPVVRQWLADGNGKGIDVYSISTSASSDRPNWPASTWLSGANWPVPVLVDDKASTAGSAFGLSSFPYFVFVNSDGTVAVRGSGEVSPDQLTQLASSVK